MQKEKWNARYREKEPHAHDEPSAHLKETLRDLSPGRALDLAAGDGRNALWLAGQGWEVSAVDFSEEAVQRGLELAKERGVSVDWRVADLLDYVPLSAAYDLVCIFYLHIPFNEFEQVLRKAAEALRPGGTLLTVGHDRRNLTEGSGGPQNPEILYTPAEVSAALEGLNVEYAGSERRPPDHGSCGPDAVQIDCVVRARRPAGR
jgi:SAM-dependent methyltransferase